MNRLRCYFDQVLCALLAPVLRLVELEARASKRRDDELFDKLSKLETTIRERCDALDAGVPAAVLGQYGTDEAASIAREKAMLKFRMERQTTEALKRELARVREILYAFCDEKNMGQPKANRKSSR
jgi:hypothetical protein